MIGKQYQAPAWIWVVGTLAFCVFGATAGTVVRGILEPDRFEPSAAAYADLQNAGEYEHFEQVIARLERMRHAKDVREADITWLRHAVSDDAIHPETRQHMIAWISDIGLRTQEAGPDGEPPVTSAQRQALERALLLVMNNDPLDDLRRTAARAATDLGLQQNPAYTPSIERVLGAAPTN